MLSAKDKLQTEHNKQTQMETKKKIFSRQWKSIQWIFRPYVQEPSQAQYENTSNGV